jgi:hypothetical protein
MQPIEKPIIAFMAWSLLEFCISDTKREGGEIPMKCPFLQGTYLLSCKASREVYVPSQFEFDEYCTHGRHTMCPFYFNAVYDRSFTVAVKEA